MDEKQLLLKTENISKPLDVEINGDEKWLESISSHFPPPPGEANPKLTGLLTIKPAEFGEFLVEGGLTYSPYVKCSRCDFPIQWPIEKKVLARFKGPSTFSTAPETDLSSHDMDDYPIEEGQINLEQVTIDSIMTEIPERTVRHADGSSKCLLCDKELEENLVSRSKPVESDNPFAVLKNLNLPDS